MSRWGRFRSRVLERLHASSNAVLLRRGLKHWKSNRRASLTLHHLGIMETASIAQGPRSVGTSSPFWRFGAKARVAFSRGCGARTLLVLGLAARQDSALAQCPLLRDGSHVLLSLLHRLLVISKELDLGLLRHAKFLVRILSSSVDGRRVRLVIAKFPPLRHILLPLLLLQLPPRFRLLCQLEQDVDDRFSPANHLLGFVGLRVRVRLVRVRLVRWWRLTLQVGVVVSESHDPLAMFDDLSNGLVWSGIRWWPRRRMRKRRGSWSDRCPTATRLILLCGWWHHLLTDS